MRLIAGMAVALAVAGCSGIRYQGTEQQMQQVARGAAEMAKKNPNSDMVTGAGTAAHMVLTATLGQDEPPEAIDAAGKPCVQMLSGCYQSRDAQAPDAKNSMESYSGLPKDFYKSTSIGKD